MHCRVKVTSHHAVKDLSCSFYVLLYVHIRTVRSFPVYILLPGTLGIEKGSWIYLASGYLEATDPCYILLPGTLS